MNVTLTRELFKLCVLGLLFVSKTTHIVRKDAEPLISAHGDLCFKNLFKALCNSSRSKSASESSDFCLLLALLSCSSASDSSTPVFGTSGGTTNLTFFCLFVLVDFANELSTAPWRPFFSRSFFASSGNCCSFLSWSLPPSRFLFLGFFHVEALAEFHSMS